MSKFRGFIKTLTKDYYHFPATILFSLINYGESIYLDRFYSILNKEKRLQLEKDVVKLAEEGVGEGRDLVSWQSDINIQELLELRKYFISPFKIKC